jgi:hypothetical protein
MSCGSANRYMSDLVGSVKDQVDNSVHGVIAPASYQYRMPTHQGSVAEQVGGRGRRSRRIKRRRNTSKQNKKRSNKRKSRRMIRKR